MEKINKILIVLVVALVLFSFGFIVGKISKQSTTDTSFIKVDTTYNKVTLDSIKYNIKRKDSIIYDYKHKTKYIYDEIKKIENDSVVKLFNQLTNECQY